MFFKDSLILQGVCGSPSRRHLAFLGACNFTYLQCPSAFLVKSWEHWKAGNDPGIYNFQGNRYNTNVSPYVELNHTPAWVHQRKLSSVFSIHHWRRHQWQFQIRAHAKPKRETHLVTQSAAAFWIILPLLLKGRWVYLLSWVYSNL